MTGNDENTIPRTHLTAADIPWNAEAVPRLEAEHVLTMSEFELLAYSESLQTECRWLRQLLHEALALVARQRDELARAARIADALRREVRALRPDIAA